LSSWRRRSADGYRETDGEEDHDWQGTTVLLLTTTGRSSGDKRTTPLIYQRHGDDYLVVASNGGGDPPGWLLNLQGDLIVAVQVKADHHAARARVATAEEKPELWRIMTAIGAPYDECSETDEASFNAAENERQRATHNPRVGGSSPSSGIEEAPQIVRASFPLDCSPIAELVPGLGGHDPRRTRCPAPGRRASSYAACQRPSGRCA
jgi:deazaflavin-dependent oxidoreductase (nitroreductase family)